jgi:hypothetical protein
MRLTRGTHAQAGSRKGAPLAGLFQVMHNAGGILMPGAAADPEMARDGGRGLSQDLQGH